MKKIFLALLISGCASEQSMVRTRILSWTVKEAKIDNYRVEVKNTTHEKLNRNSERSLAYSTVVCLTAKTSKTKPYSVTGYYGNGRFSKMLIANRSGNRPFTAVYSEKDNRWLMKGAAEKTIMPLEIYEISARLYEGMGKALISGKVTERHN
jgi:hypothetical protein